MVSAKIIAEKETTPPEPMPCIARPAMIMFMFCAAPQTALPAAEKAKEKSNAGFRPKAWAIPPVIGRVAKAARSNVELIHTKL